MNYSQTFQLMPDGSGSYFIYNDVFKLVFGWVAFVISVGYIGVVGISFVFSGILSAFFREERRYGDDITGLPEHDDGFSGFSISRTDLRVGFSTSQQLLRMQANWNIYITRQVSFQVFAYSSWTYRLPFARTSLEGWLWGPGLLLSMYWGQQNDDLNLSSYFAINLRGSCSKQYVSLKISNPASINLLLSSSLPDQLSLISDEFYVAPE